jgi:YfiH family protein
MRASRGEEQGANRLHGPRAKGRVPAMPSPEDHERGLPFWRPRPTALPATAWFGMTTRAGGASMGPFATLNLGLRVGDDPAAIAENRRRLRAALPCGDGEPRLLHQVHGRKIVTPKHGVEEADGFLVRAGDPWVAVSAADCAAVAVVVEDGAVGALLHSGWRGARARIAANAVALLEAEGIRPERLRAAIGPCLHACCFPVGPEVAREFPDAMLVLHPTGREALDLPRAIATGLLEAGVAERHIEISPDCTSCRREAYFSHRRDRGLTGRHWGLLHLATPAA